MNRGTDAVDSGHTYTVRTSLHRGRSRCPQTNPGGGSPPWPSHRPRSVLGRGHTCNADLHDVSTL
jgi:hypothetical protein